MSLGKLARKVYSLEGRQKIADYRRARPHSEETKAKIAAAMKGRAKTPEHTEKAVRSNAKRFARLKRRGRSARLTPDERLHLNSALASQTAKKQWHTDYLNACLMKNYELAQDVRISQGFLCYRNLFDRSGKVSHGWFMGTIRRPHRWVPADGKWV